jgi:hypothetical protein
VRTSASATQRRVMECDTQAIFRLTQGDSPGMAEGSRRVRAPTRCPAAVPAEFPGMEPIREGICRVEKTVPALQLTHGASGRISTRNWTRMKQFVLALALTLSLGAAAFADFNGGGTITITGRPTPHMAPGPILSAGLPVLAAGLGVYWMARRRRRRSS